MNMYINFKTTGAAICMATVFALSATTGMANVLANPGFEGDAAPGLAGWNVGSFGGTVESTTAYAQAGSQSLMIDSTGAGQWSSPQVYQDFAASAGQEWNFSGYMMTLSTLPNFDPDPASFGLFKIVFQDVNNVDLIPTSASIGTINFSFPGVESTPQLNNTSALSTWIFSEAQGIAPTGTDHVRLFVLNVNGSANTMYFDSISASIIPEPSMMALAGVGMAALLAFRRRN